MGKNSKIEWTHHTFNPWWGCVRLSPACKHCYAESWARRVGSNVWGSTAERRFFGDSHWNEPIKWNKEAGKARVRLRVFCASMGDIFEKRPELNIWRSRLWTLIDSTPELDWLLLTKRPDHVQSMVPWKSDWPQNVWLGTTVENQHWAEKRLPILVDIPAKIRFISAEPLLGPLEISKWLDGHLDWVITGGESGPRARPSSPRWFKGLMQQCMKAAVPFHFKQWGDWAPEEHGTFIENALKVRTSTVDGATMLRVGKKSAGRHLDGAIWDGVPNYDQRPARLSFQ